MNNTTTMHGILGIAAAPDFIQDIYSSSTLEKQVEWKENGVAYVPSRYGDPYPITWKLIQNAAQNWRILPSTKTAKPAAKTAKLSVHCPVHLIHGKRDEDISWKKSMELSKLLLQKGSNQDGNEGGDILTLIEDGDHRLSRPQDIELMLKTLDSMVKH